MGTGDQCLVRQLKRGHNLFPGHSGEVVEELVDAIAGFEIVDQTPYGHARADEDRNAAQDFGIAVHDGRPHGTLQPNFGGDVAEGGEQDVVLLRAADRDAQAIPEQRRAVVADQDAIVGQPVS